MPSPGPQKPQPGFFEQANGGTVFLDEIGEMAMAMQVKLLRVLQEREIVRLGSNRPLAIDIRLVSATHKRPGHGGAEGLFPREIYTIRLNIVPISHAAAAASGK